MAGLVIVGAIAVGIIYLIRKKSQYRYKYRTLDDSMRILSGVETGIL